MFNSFKITTLCSLLLISGYVHATEEIKEKGSLSQSRPLLKKLDDEIAKNPNSTTQQDLDKVNDVKNFIVESVEKSKAIDKLIDLYNENNPKDIIIKSSDNVDFLDKYKKPIPLADYTGMTIQQELDKKAEIIQQNIDVIEHNIRVTPKDQKIAITAFETLLNVTQNQKVKIQKLLADINKNQEKFQIQSNELVKDEKELTELLQEYDSLKPGYDNVKEKLERLNLAELHNKELKDMKDTFDNMKLRIDYYKSLINTRKQMIHHMNVLLKS